MKVSPAMQVRKQAVLDALAKTLGVVTSACRLAEVPRSVFYEWIAADPDFAKSVKELEDVALDFAETSLFKQIQKGEAAATIFYLKTKGKRRGFIERQEIAGPDGGPVSVNPYSSLEDAALVEVGRRLLLGESPAESER